MNELESTRIVESWLDEPGPPLPARAITQVIEQLPSTPQRKRWWPVRWYPFGIGAMRSTSQAAPRQDRRQKGMFNATRVAAAVSIISLTGVFAVVAGPLGGGPDGAVTPGAQASPSPVAPGQPVDESYVTGSMRFGSGSSGMDRTGPEGIKRNRGAEFSITWSSEDPRFTGVGDYTSNTNTYTDEAGDEISVGWGTVTLVNDEGSWRTAGVVPGVVRATDSHIPSWVVGEGAYAGQTALMVHVIDREAGPPFKWDFEAWIVPGDAHIAEAQEAARSLAASE
jgi:hypothetical protein